MLVLVINDVADDVMCLFNKCLYPSALNGSKLLLSRKIRVDMQCLSIALLCTRTIKQWTFSKDEAKRFVVGQPMT